MVTEAARGALAEWLQAHMIAGTAFTFLEAAAFSHPSLRWLDEGRPRIVPRVGCGTAELPGLSLAAMEVPPLALRVLYPDRAVYLTQDPVHLLAVDLAGAHHARTLLLQGAQGEARGVSVELGPQGAASVTLEDLSPGAWQVTWQDAGTSSPDGAPCRFTVTDDPADLVEWGAPRSSTGASGSSAPHVFTSLARHDVLGCLDAGRGAGSVRGLHLSQGPAVHDWPLELERVDTARARLRVTRDIESACVVVVDPLSGPSLPAEPCRLLRDLARDQVVEVEVPSPIGLLLVGAYVAGAPFEGAAVTVGPESMACRVALPRDPHAGEPLDIVVHARGVHVAETVAHLVVKDVRLPSAPSPLVQLASAIHGFAASHSFRTRSPRRLHHAATRRGTHAMPPDVGQFLVAQGLLTARQQERVQDEARRHARDFVVTALELEFFSEEELGRTLASWVDVAFFDLDREIVEADVTRCLCRDLARRHGAVPVQRQGDSLYVALLDPLDEHALDEVAGFTSLDVVPLLATAPALGRALERFYGSDAASGSQDPPPHQGREAVPRHPAPRLPAPGHDLAPPRALHAGLIPLVGGVGRLSLVLPRTLTTYRVEAFVFCGVDWCEATTAFTAGP